MNTKQIELMEVFLKEIPSDIRNMFRELSEYAIEFGYTPKRTKTSLFGLDFSSSKLGQTIMKLEVGKPNKNNPAFIGKPSMRLRFFATPKYSEIFENSIKKAIEAFNFKYTGCYGCGRCDGSNGYKISYSDGRNFYRCGGELIPIDGYDENYTEEIKQMIKTQDDFYRNKSKS